MVLPPLPMEDQTDEDFFDNLVDDEVGGVVCEPCSSNNVGSNVEEAFANLSVKEVGNVVDGFDNVDRVEGSCSEKSGNHDIASCNVDDSKVEDLGAEGKGGDMGFAKIVNQESSNHGVVGTSESDSRMSGNGANASAGIQEVQWSSFSSGIQEASFSDYFNQIGDDSDDPFAELDGGHTVASDTLDGGSSNPLTTSSSFSFEQSGEDMQHASSMECKGEFPMPDQSSIQYWESLYPGWRYDPNTGQWNHVVGFDGMVNNAEYNNANARPTSEQAIVNPTSDAYYLQHTAQSVSGSMSEESTAGTLSYWNQPAYGNTEYPAHMVFDPLYPGWYYDAIALEWRSLETYKSSINQSFSLGQSQRLAYESASTTNFVAEQNITYGQGEQVNNRSYQVEQPMNWRDFGNDALNASQPGEGRVFSSAESTQFGNKFTSNGAVNYSLDHRTVAAPYENSNIYEQPRQAFDNNNGFNRFQSPSVANTGLHNFGSVGNSLQHNNYCKEPDHHQLSSDGFNAPNVLHFAQQPLQNSRSPYSSIDGRSPDGRPGHALVSFGFGGKLLVMKDQSSLHTQPAYTNQDSAGGVINILNMMEVAMPKNDGSDLGFGDCEYIRTLCQQSFSGALLSGNVGSKELNKWIDDRIANCNAPDTDYRKSEVLKMLLSLLKIACQYYGKLRSAYGTDHGSKATAEEVQSLLVSGRKMEALQCAQNGQLWGPAIVIASLLGEQFYGETVKQMALHQLVAGSPLRTLCLLIAGQPAEVFSNTNSSNPQTGVNVSQSSWVGPGCMLEEWEENLAIISANRTKGDELVITHLGDCLWRERSEVMAAHICYLVAEANIESYSESARLCLVGADHLKYPRTYFSPEAIQRTELYEYAKVLGNSQFVLLPFQPYKFLYACMLAEVGKLSESLKYCQAVLKSLKNGRSPEVDACRHMVSSLEDRIKFHQQGGYVTNFSGAKLVGKLRHLFDNTAQRVVGGLPPPTPSNSHSNGQQSDYDHQSRGPRVSTSQSTMAMSSLMTSASADGNDRKSFHNRSMSEPDFGRTPRKDESPKSSSSSPRDNASLSRSSSRLGRFGSQIFQKTVGLVLRSNSDNQASQAKLGETNKFYYDEKLKRWVEEGAEPQAEEMTFAPPPTTTTFMNGMPNHDRKHDSSNATSHANGNSEHKHTNSSGQSAELPPIPSGTNHFTARGRMGVRARYVDTFNKGGGTPANSFQSPSPLVPAMKPAVGNPKIFIPTPVTGGQETDSTESTQQTVVTDHDTTTADSHNSFSSPQVVTPLPTIHGYPSMDKGMGSMVNSNGSSPQMVTPLPAIHRHHSLDQGMGSMVSSNGPSPQMVTPLSTIQRHSSMDKGMGNMVNSNGPLPPNARRTLSWGGGLDLSNHTSVGEAKPSTDVPGFPLSA
ncbi:Protein transport protein SEC16B-like protein [Bienertia sinuspersici]